jgi:hypothetical protein
MMSVKCNHCGLENRLADETCRNCGAELDGKATEGFSASGYQTVGADVTGSESKPRPELISGLLKRPLRWSLILLMNLRRFSPGHLHKYLNQYSFRGSECGCAYD